MTDLAELGSAVLAELGSAVLAELGSAVLAEVRLPEAEAMLEDVL